MQVCKYKIILVAFSFTVIAACGSEGGSAEKKKTTITQELQHSKANFFTVEPEVIQTLNQLIVDEKLNDPLQVVNLYKPKLEVEEGRYSYSLSMESLADGSMQYTVIEDELLDDSIQGEKTIIRFETAKGTLFIKEIKKQFKCRAERGQQDWGPDFCL
ncbi:MAG: hypothetical protein ACXITV_07435 [Luteibaculaceae bacterium]